MSGLRPAGLGPIIGHTTATTCRIWIQAPGLGGPGTRESDRRSVGVIGIVSRDGAAITEAYYFRLHREYDRSGTFVVGGDVAMGHHETDGVTGAALHPARPLKPDTDYTVRAATLTVDDPIPDSETISDVELAALLPPIENIAPLLLQLPAAVCEVKFRTFPDTLVDRLDFLLGSCRYPGLLWKIKEADRIFEPMNAHLRDAGAARFTLMVGDQIYADMFNRLPIKRADTYEEFQQRYQTAFSSPHMRELLRSAPVYMILDDHEIEDNWSYDSKDHDLFNLAIGAYASYQWSHSPRTYGNRFYYRFECAGYPFFVLDTRTLRTRGKDRERLEDNHLLGRPNIDADNPGQLAALLAWLRDAQAKRQNVPKFIVSPSVFAPNPMSERLAPGFGEKPKGKKGKNASVWETNREARHASDSWPAFPATRAALLEEISASGVRNVVFLTGDVHCSNVARIEIPSKPHGVLTAWDVTSSAFYWPFFFADGDPNDFVHDSRDPAQADPFPISAGPVHYEAFAFTQDDNFARLEIDRAKSELRVRYFDVKGRPIRLKATDAAGVLPLALDAW